MLTKIIFFGTPEFAVPSLKVLIRSGHDLCAVVTQPDRQSGRGRRITPCPVKAEALKHRLSILQPNKVREGSFIERVKALKPSLIVVAAYGQILPSEILKAPESGCINIHASLLPQYRGAAPIHWAIMNGESKTGITIMLMDEGMDTGPVLLQEEVEIDAEDTAGSLSRRLSEIGAEVLMKALKGIEDNSLTPVPQTGDVSYAPVLKKTDGLIDWSKSARELHNFIRGMTPWPGAYSFLEKERIKIIKAVPVAGTGEPGVMSRSTKDTIFVGTGEDLISIVAVQPSGKSIMPVESFLQGRKIHEGIRFHEKPVD